MGWIDNLFKTKSQKDAEMKAYYNWAYPYGEEQKAKIHELIKAVVPDEDEKFAIYNYLVCRQEMAPKLYEGPYNFNFENLPLVKLNLKKQYNSKGKKQMHRYIALADADLRIDMRLEYPTVEQIIENAEKIKEIL